MSFMPNCKYTDIFLRWIFLNSVFIFCFTVRNFVLFILKGSI